MSTQFSQAVIRKALEDRPWIRKVAPNRYRVTPRTADHGKYELIVSYDEEGNPQVDDCYDYRINEQCLGFKYNHGNCYHACRLLIHLLPKAKAA